MSGKGYHLALDAEQAARLLACRSEDEVVACASDLLEGFWESESFDRTEGYDKDWFVLLLCLTEGSFDPEGGEPPLNRCFFGGHLLARSSSIVNLVASAEVPAVAEALDAIDPFAFRERYARLPPNRFFERSESWALDEEYGYYLFRNLRKLAKFYRRAAEAGRAVAFYTDEYLERFHDPPSDE